MTIRVIFGTQPLKSRVSCVDDALVASAEEAARRLAAQGGEELAASLSMRDFVKQAGNDTAAAVAGVTTLVVATTTTRQGDAPDNAMRFVRKLTLLERKREKKGDAAGPPPFQNLRYCVVGVDDPDSDYCNQTAKTVHRLLEALGARPIMDARLLAGTNGASEADSAALRASLEQWQRDVVAKAAMTADGGSDAKERDEKNDKEVHERSVLLLYGSQTGNSEEIGKMVALELNTRMQACADWRGCDVMSMKQYLNSCNNPRKPATALAAEKRIIVITSTTGNGDAPDNALRMWRRLRTDKTEGALRGVEFALLGLGDTNYDNFNKTAKSFDAKFRELGATPFFPTAFADDAVGLDIVVEPWRKGVVEAVEKLFGHKCVGGDDHQRDDDRKAAESSPNKKSKVKRPRGLAKLRPCGIRMTFQCTAEELNNNNNNNNYGGNVPSALPNSCIRDTTRSLLNRWQAVDTETVLNGYTPEAPLTTTLKSARFLTRPHSEKHVLHVELELPSDSAKDGILYSPGDALGVYCPNEAGAVDRILKRLGTLVKADNSGGDGSDAPIIDIADRPFVISERPPLTEEQNARKGSKKHRLPSDRVAVQVVDTLSRSPSPDNDSDSDVDASDRKTEHSGCLPSRCTPREALTYFCDITSPPRKNFLRMLGEYCSEASDKETLFRWASLSGRDEYQREVLDQRLSLEELLDMFPSCDPPLEHLIDQLPSMKPRYYSVASGSSQHPTTVHIALTVVDFVTPAPHKRRRRGLCSHWLYRLCVRAGLLEGARDHVHTTAESPDELKKLVDDDLVGYASCPNNTIAVPVFLRRAQFFAPPDDVSKPMIMIGPGTGVAPFRGFLQSRRTMMQGLRTDATGVGWWRGLDMEHEGEDEESSSEDFSPHPFAQASEPVSRMMSPSNVGCATLFFGCRRSDEDYLYREDLERFVADGTLNHLYTAFSREQEHKVYVQDRIREHGAELAQQIIDQGAFVFVCGDGAKMAKDVLQALQQILADHLESLAEARQYVLAMTRNKRLVQDIWS